VSPAARVSPGWVCSGRINGALIRFWAARWSIDPVPGTDRTWPACRQGELASGLVGAGWAPLPAPYTGSYYYKCLEYLPNPLVSSNANWLRWDSATGDWQAMPLAQYGTYCENQ
jgi:hypothetical protein